MTSGEKRKELATAAEASGKTMILQWVKGKMTLDEFLSVAEDRAAKKEMPGLKKFLENKIQRIQEKRKSDINGITVAARNGKVGCAVCSDLDQYNHKIGYFIARGRLNIRPQNING